MKLFKKKKQPKSISDIFKPEDNIPKCVYGPPEWFKNKNMDIVPEDDEDTSKALEEQEPSS